MKTIVSFIGDKTQTYEELNRKAGEYALKSGLQYVWAPQSPYSIDDVISHLENADVGIINTENYGAEIFSRIHKRCKLLVRFGVGFDKVDLAAATKYGIAIARTTGANTLGVAEMAFSLILSGRRKLKYFDKAVVSADWAKVVVEETIGGVIGIIGFGAIGRALAKLFSGWDCKIVVYDPFPDEKGLKELGARLVSLEELFRTADAISLHLPYTPETHHLIDERLLGMMKSSAVLVNTSRGNIVNEEALARALKEGRINAAGFDVFAQEPLPTASPLIGLDNAVLTPHVSSQTTQSLWRIYQMAVNIAADFTAGRDSPHILNPDYNEPPCGKREPEVQQGILNR